MWKNIELQKRSKSNIINIISLFIQYDWKTKEWYKITIFTEFSLTNLTFTNLILVNYLWDQHLWSLTTMKNILLRLATFMWLMPNLTVFTAHAPEWRVFLLKMNMDGVLDHIKISFFSELNECHVIFVYKKGSYKWLQPWITKIILYMNTIHTRRGQIS